MSGMTEEQAAESITVAREFVQELRSNTALLSNDLLRALRDVAFVPATKVSFQNNVAHMSGHDFLSKLMKGPKNST